MPPINVYSGWLVFYLVVNSCSWTWSRFFSADHPAIQADSGTSPWQEDRAWHVMSFTHGNGTKHGKTRQNMGAYTWKPGCCIWYPPKGSGRPDPNHQSFGGSMSITVRWMVEKTIEGKAIFGFSFPDAAPEITMITWGYAGKSAASMKREMNNWARAS